MSADDELPDWEREFLSRQCERGAIPGVAAGSPDCGEARAVREAARISLREAAKVLNVSAAALSRWETGQAIPRPEDARRWAELVGELRKVEPTPEPARKVVARNVRKLRIARGWTQGEAGELLAQYGFAWSKANWSVAERAADKSRIRAFTADEIWALAQLFEVTPNDLFDASMPCPTCSDAPPPGFVCMDCGRSS